MLFINLPCFFWYFLNDIFYWCLLNGGKFCWMLVLVVRVLDSVQKVRKKKTSFVTTFRRNLFSLQISRIVKHYSFSLKMETVGSSETLVHIYQTAQRHNPEKCYLNAHSCENLISCRRQDPQLTSLQRSSAFCREQACSLLDSPFHRAILFT
jgi:hypothetical protein